MTSTSWLYRDRKAVPHGPSFVPYAHRDAVIFQHALVIAGRVAGTWRMTRDSGGRVIHAYSLRPLTRPERRALPDAVERYARFLGESLRLSAT